MTNATEPYSTRRLRLTLCDPNEPAHELDLDFRVFDTPIASRWADIVVFFSVCGAHIYDPERFYHYPNDPKETDAWLVQELKRCVDGINRFRPGHIDIEINDSMDQAKLNELHERFAHGTALDYVTYEHGQPTIRNHDAWERCRGAVRAFGALDLQPSTPRMTFVEAIARHPSFGIVFQDFTESYFPELLYLLSLNKAIHRREELTAYRVALARGGSARHHFEVNFAPHAVVRMHREDLTGFTLAKSFGRVYLADMLPGKCIWDVYRDKDEHIIDDHFKNFAYYMADFNVYMGRPTTPNWETYSMRDFWRWFTKNEARLNRAGFFRDKPEEMTIGTMPVADLDRRGLLEGKDDAAIVELVGQYQMMKRVAIVDDDGTEGGKIANRSRFFDLYPTWSEVLARIGGSAEDAGTY
jgi:hypothetical protein